MLRHVPVPYMDPPAVARFYSYIDKTGGEDACWLWQLGTASGGYGRVKLGGIALRTHRVAYYLGNGVDAGDKMVCHRCDTPLCCNPRHLFLGDHGENMKDMARKGRAKGGSPAGESAHNAKLSAADVDRIRSMIAAGSTNKAIGRVFGVTHQAISRIRRGRAWGTEALQPKYQSLKRLRGA